MKLARAFNLAFRYT